MYTFFVSGQIDRYSNGKKMESFSVALRIPHHNQLLTALSRKFFCRKEDLRITQNLAKPQGGDDPACDRTDLKDLLKDVLEPNPSIDISCDTLEASLRLTKDFQMILDDFDGLCLYVYCVNTGHYLFKEKVHPESEQLAQAAHRGIQEVERAIKISQKVAQDKKDGSY